MLRRSVVLAVVGSAALVGSAAAFSPMMSMETGRRQVVQAGAAAATVAPLLRSKPAEASNFRPGFPGRAPVITVFDHRGCTSHSNVEYTGEPAKRADAKDKKFKYNGEDEMLDIVTHVHQVKVQNKRIAPNENLAASTLAETISVIATNYQ